MTDPRSALARTPAGKLRGRGLGIPFDGVPGENNAITDVAGVAVGYTTLIDGDGALEIGRGPVRTGVTAILPRGRVELATPVFAGSHSLNGNGEMTGQLWIEEAGRMDGPIVLTNTLSVGTAVAATVAWTLRQPGHEDVRSVNAVVGETNDGFLNDIRGFHVKAEDVWAAIDAARGGPVAEGSVGAGTGTRLFAWKGGIGTSSRVLPESLGGFTVGALVQTNFGGILTVDGAPVGELLGQYAFKDQLENAPPGGGDASAPGDGSCMIVLATDAPLSPRNLERLARRAELGLARTGSFVSNGTGDFIIAFSTANLVGDGDTPTRVVGEEVRNRAMSPLFLAAVEAVEEAVYNSLTAATSVIGRDGNVAEAIPIDRLAEILAAQNDRKP